MSDPASPVVRNNDGLTTLTDGLCGTGGPYGNGPGMTINSPFPLGNNLNYHPITLQRILLSYSFMSLGLVQTVVKQPVEDAFRGGFTIHCNEISEEEMKAFMISLKRSRKRNKFRREVAPQSGVRHGNSDISVVMAALDWKRLYGGAGLIVNTDQDFRLPLDVDAIKKDSPLEFIAADRWELILNSMNIYDERNPTPFNYYGLPLHQSRVIKVLGVEAPSYIRLRLQGWGMSELERCIRAINSFVKFEALIFELIDEAKIDVFKINGFNDSLLTDNGTQTTQQRIQLANQLKNFQDALVMDSEDDYAQKQLTWSGLADLWEQLRLNLSSSLKIPMNKLFGQSATGFGGGEDSIENYNSIVEQTRVDAEPLLTEVVDLRMQQRFGFIPDYELEWPSLRILDGVQEEVVQTSKQNRTLELFKQRLLTGREASQVLQKDKLITMETEVSKGLRDVEPTMPNEGEPSDGSMQMAKDKQKTAA
jgi:phage-related protein (TIGR01555 family)